MALAQTALPQQRHRALAELNAQIELAERTCVRCRLDVQDMTTPKFARRASTLLRLAEERLEQLRKSQQVLLADVLEQD
jgi:hypothetical protein